MKKLKIGLLAITALVGVSAAFAAKHRLTNKYAVLGLTVNGHGYIIKAWPSNGDCDQTPSVTCSITSTASLQSPVSTSASNIKKYTQGFYFEH